MVAKPKTASWWSRNKTIVLVTLTGMALVVAALFAFYQSQRPNYRDLEREYQSLNIPANWQLISNKNNNGFLGITCFQIAGETCPYLSSRYTLEYLTIEKQLVLSEQIVGDDWVYIGLFNEETCKASSDPLSCEYIFEKGSTRAVIGYSNISPTGEASFYSSVSISAKE